MTASDPTPPNPRLLALMQGSLFGRPLTPRRAARLIAAATLLMTVVGGVAVRLVDGKEFHNLGDSMWWAIQTVTTVGYGDVVPENVGGRLVGGILMLNGIAFLTVITAAVTAMLIEQARQRRPVPDDDLRATLDRIESRLDELAPGGPPRPDQRAD